MSADLQGIKLPASCKACGQCDLWPANHEAWQFYQEYPSLIRNGMDGWQVDISAALDIADRTCRSDAPLLVRRLEAIKSGFASAK